MEILSIGEKIKRTRVYQGITLKELCGKKISISKMSCIENDKIKVNKDILSYIADKLGVDYDYLAQDVHEQISNNLKLIRNSSTAADDIEKIIKHNLNYAIDYAYYDLAFELMNILFNYYIDNSMYEEIQRVIPRYYELYSNDTTDENTIIYYKDIANFFYCVGEYKEAVGYYKRIRKLLSGSEIIDKESYVYNCLKESIYYREEGLISEAYEVLIEGSKYIYSIPINKDKAEIYKNLFILNIMLDKLDAGKEYLEKVYEYLKDDKLNLAIAKRDIAESKFSVNLREEALEEIKESIDIFPNKDAKSRVEFLNKCIKILYDYEEYSLAYEISDIALDMAIRIDEIEVIEEAYYFKAMLLQKKGMYSQAEMYMNLSLDSLFKLDNNEKKKYKRYLDMAEMYYKLGEKRDALKYFNLAIAVEENM